MAGSTVENEEGLRQRIEAECRSVVASNGRWAGPRSLSFTGQGSRVCGGMGEGYRLCGVSGGPGECDGILQGVLDVSLLNCCGQASEEAGKPVQQPAIFAMEYAGPALAS